VLKVPLPPYNLTALLKTPRFSRVLFGLENFYQH
jgi:hypothetical protein